MKKTTLFNSDENRIEKAKRWLRLLSISTAFFVGQSVFGQDVGTIQIGSGTSTGTAIPVTNYVSSYSQQIVTAAEYASGGGAAGEITKLRYYPTNVGTVTVWNNLTVYIGNTTKTAFSSTTDWVPLTELTQVFSGVITPDPVSNSWFEIVFTAPFDYTGGNIVIAVDENTPNWSTAPTFRSYTSTANSGIVYRSDSVNPDPASPPTATTRVSALPQIQFEGTLASCVAPLGLVSANVTATTADISWDPSASSSAVGYEYVYSTSSTPPTGPGTSTGSSAETFVELASLNSETVYYLFVRTDCGSGSFSEWSLPISFTTLCFSVSSFTEGFESTTGTNLPSCWFKVGATGTANTQASTGFGSTRSLYMYSSTSTSRAVVSLPPVNNADADTHRMVMKVRANFTVGETIELGYLTNPADASTFMALNSIVTNSTTVPQTFSTTPTGLPSGDVVFALRTGTALLSVLIDDVTWEPLPLCPDQTGLVVANITTDGAETSWDDMSANGATGYEYAVTTSATPPTSGTATTDTFYVASTLASNTVHYLHVRTSCGGGEFGIWVTKSFRTACTAFTEFSENFDTVTTPGLPSCWGKILSGATLSTFATVGTSTTNASAPNGVDLYNSSTGAADNIILVTPILSNLSEGTHRLKFKARNTTDSQDLQIGVLTDVADASTFTLVQDVDITTTFQDYVVNFDGYTGPGVAIGIRRLSTSTYTNVYLDDIVWEAIPSCPDQTGLVVGSITSDGAATSWDDMSANGATGYEYAVTTSATPPTSGTATTDTFYVASTLASNAVHYLHVRTSCSGGQFGNWTSISFRTLCAAVAAPTVAETFTTYLPSCWSEATGALTASSTLNNVDGAWISYQFAGVSTSNMGTKVNLYGGSTATPDNDWMISSPIDLGSTPGLYRVKYKSALTSYNGTTAQTNLGTHVVKVVVSTDGGTSWSDSNVIKTYSGTYTPTSSETIDLTAYSGVVKIGFVATSTSLSPDIDFHIDDFIVEAIPSCPDVTGLVVSSITSDSASTSWDDMSASGATGYEYAVTTTVTPPASGTATTDTFYLASGLDSNTVHYLHVRTDCGSGSFGNWVTTSFTTLCSSVTSFTEGFETTTGALFPSCWSKVGGSGSAYTQASTGISGARNVYMYSSSATSRPVVAMIPVSNASAGTHRMVMKVRANFTAGETIELGYLTTPTDATTFTPINSIVTNSTTVPQSFITIPSGLPSGDVVFALRTGTALLSVLIDDVTWEPIPLCPDQTGLVVANITSDGAETSWDDMSGNGAVGYEYAVTTSATPPVSGTATTDTFYEATSLASNTMHYLHVRTVCSGGEFGNWSTLSFTTLVAPSTIPWNENFDVTGTPGGWTTNGYTVAAANASIGFPASIKFGDGTTNVIRRNSWEFSTTGSFTTNSAGEIAAGQVLSFNYKLINYPDDNQPSVGSGNYTVEISIDNGATYDLVETVTNDGVAGWQTKTYPLDAYVGEFIKVKITDTWSGTDVDADYFIGFDNFYIGEELSSPSFDKSALKVYPNPTRNILYVNYNQEISNVEVYNLVGQRVATIAPNANEGQIDMSNLASGAYFVKVTSNNATRTVKVIKE